MRGLWLTPRGRCVAASTMPPPSRWPEIRSSSAMLEAASSPAFGSSRSHSAMRPQRQAGQRHAPPLAVRETAHRQVGEGARLHPVQRRIDGPSSLASRSASPSRRGSAVRSAPATARRHGRYRGPAHRIRWCRWWPEAVRQWSAAMWIFRCRSGRGEAPPRQPASQVTAPAAPVARHVPAQRRQGVGLRAARLDHELWRTGWHSCPRVYSLRRQGSRISGCAFGHTVDGSCVLNKKLASWVYSFMDAAGISRPLKVKEATHGIPNFWKTDIHHNSFGVEHGCYADNIICTSGGLSLVQDG